MLQLRIESEILALLGKRDRTASACPSEIARKLVKGPEWRTLMPSIRHVLGALSKAGLVSVTRGNAVLGASDFRGGPIRFRRGERYQLALVSHRHDD